MTPGPVEIYLAAQAAFAEADRAVSDLMRVLLHIAGVLGDAAQRGRLIFHGTGIGLPWPAGAAYHAIAIADGAWPDAARLQAALVAWHATHAAVRAAWDALPDRFKPALPHPPAALRTDKLESENALHLNRPRPALAEM